jgi:hypothetical protein
MMQSNCNKIAQKETATRNSICPSQMGKVLFYPVNASLPSAATVALEK